MGGCSFLFFSINALGILRRKLACDLAGDVRRRRACCPGLSRPGHVACAAHCGRRGRLSLHAAIYLQPLCEKAGRLYCHALPASSGRQSLQDYRDSERVAAATKKRAAPSADERGKCFRTFLPRTTLLRDASENFEDFRNTFGARLRGIYRGAVLKSAALCRGTPGNSDITPLSSVGPLFV